MSGEIADIVRSLKRDGVKMRMERGGGWTAPTRMLTREIRREGAKLVGFFQAISDGVGGTVFGRARLMFSERLLQAGLLSANRGQFSGDEFETRLIPSLAYLKLSRSRCPDPVVDERLKLGGLHLRQSASSAVKNSELSGSGILTTDCSENTDARPDDSGHERSRRGSGELGPGVFLSGPCVFPQCPLCNGLIGVMEVLPCAGAGGGFRAGMDSVTQGPITDITPLSSLAARVLGCLIEKEFATPDIYPLTLNALVNACNQKSNREPVMDVTSREVEVAIEELRQQRLVVMFSGADARVAKYRQKLDEVYHPLEPAGRAVLGELLVRGPQTAAGLRANAERLYPMPPAAEFDLILAELAGRPGGALIRKLPRQPGQKEARWVQLLTGEPALESGSVAEPVTVTMTLPPEVERRLSALEAEVGQLRTELAELRKSLGE